MSAVIRLKRMGSRKRPYYRVVVMDSRVPRDGRAIDELGYYHPVENDERRMQLKTDRISEWLNKGAKPSPTVRTLIRDVLAQNHHTS